MATLLIVEDDDALRQPMREILSANGHTVFEAATAENAPVFSGHADLALFDNHLSGMDGVEAAVRFNDKKVPFVFVTGSMDKQVLQQTLDCGGRVASPDFSRRISLRSIWRRGC